MPGGLFSKARQQAPMPNPTLGSVRGVFQRTQKQKLHNNQNRNITSLKNHLVLVQTQNVDPAFLYPMV
jgi:hypothetical protein